MTRSGTWWKAGLIVALNLAAADSGRAQSVGRGSSPGRAAYRPTSQWNNGPFFSAPHWNPYAPRQAVNNGLVHSDPNAPPYTSSPRGRYPEFYPGQTPLLPFAQGFAPFSGYADWYRQANDFQPTRRDVAGATSRYFQSSPIPPSPHYLAPGVADAYYRPVSTTTPGRALAPVRRGAPSEPRVETPPEVPEGPKPRRTVIYRFGPNGLE